MRTARKDSTSEAGGSGGTSAVKSLSQANALTIPLRSQEKPIDINYNNPEVLRVIQTEYVTRFLETLGASPSRANIELVRRHVPIEEAKKTAAYKSRGAIADSLYIAPGVVKSAALQTPASLQNAQARSLIGKALLERAGAFDEKPPKKPPELPNAAATAAAAAKAVARSLHKEEEEKTKAVELPFEEVRRRYVFPFSLLDTGEDGRRIGPVARVVTGRAGSTSPPPQAPSPPPATDAAAPSRGRPRQGRRGEGGAREGSEGRSRGRSSSRSRSRSPHGPGTFSASGRFIRSGLRQEVEMRRPSARPAPPPPPEPAPPVPSAGGSRGRNEAGSAAARARREAEAEEEAAEERREALANVEREVVEELRAPFKPAAHELELVQKAFARSFPWHLLLERVPRREIFAMQAAVEGPELRALMATAVEFLYFAFLGRFRPSSPPPPPPPADLPRSRRGRVGSEYRASAFSFRSAVSASRGSGQDTDDTHRHPPAPAAAPEQAPSRRGSDLHAKKGAPASQPTSARRVSLELRNAAKIAAAAAAATEAAAAPPAAGEAGEAPRSSARSAGARSAGGGRPVPPVAEAADEAASPPPPPAEGELEAPGSGRPHSTRRLGGARSVQGSRAGSVAGSAGSGQGAVEWEDVEAARARLFGELHEQYARIVEPLRGPDRPGRPREGAARLGMLFRLPVLVTCVRASVAVLFQRRYPKWFEVGDGPEAARRMDAALLALLDPDRYLLHLTPLESSVQALRILSLKQNQVHPPITRKFYSTSPIVRALFPHAPHVRDRQARSSRPRDGADVEAALVASGPSHATSAGLAGALDSLLTDQTRDQLYALVLERIHRRHAGGPNEGAAGEAPAARPASAGQQGRPAGALVPAASHAVGSPLGHTGGSGLAHAQSSGPLALTQGSGLSHAKSRAEEGGPLMPAGPGQPFSLENIKLNLQRVLNQQAAAR